MKKNLLIIILLILLIIPLKMNAFSLEQLKKTCNPLVPLNANGTSYFCTSEGRVINLTVTGNDVFGQAATPTDEENLASYADSNVCKNTGDCFKGVGLMFQLIYYTGAGKPKAVGKKYHVYNPDLLKDQTVANKVDLPTKPYDFRDPNKNYNITQIQSPAGEIGYGWEGNWSETPEVGTFVHQDGRPYIDPATGERHDRQPPNKYLGQQDYISGMHSDEVAEDYYSYQKDYSEADGLQSATLRNKPPDKYYGHHTGYIDFIFQYNTGYSKTTYPKTKILGADWKKGDPLKAIDFSDWEEDKNLTEEEVNSNVLKDKVAKYFSRSTLSETVKAVNKKFGTNIKLEELEYYYIEVQAIYRVYTDEKTPTGGFIVRDVEEITEEESVIDDSYYVDDEERKSSKDEILCINRDKTWVTAESVRKAKAGTSPSCKSNSTAPSTVSCSLNSDKSACTDSNNCTYTPGSDAVTGIPATSMCVSSCDVNSCEAEEVPYWKREWAYPGYKVIHRLIGTAYEGWSQLLYTMSPEDESCKTSNVTTSLGDMTSQNRHCELDEYSSEYSEQEIANQCATEKKYKYYVGPDPERALVGTGDNPFNLFGSKGNRCRSGVKHYYLFDLGSQCVDCIPKCQQACADAGSKDSNTYLKCAEKYCDYDVDYSLGGQPFVRKSECILSSKFCDYQYGREPTMGSATGPNRQAVSSCANTKLFKTGSGTNYTLEKVPYNSTSNCGNTSNGSISNNVGKDSICIGDTITDYNKTSDGRKNDADDTPFDQRTYINVACQETESITSIGGLEDSKTPGLPLSYSIKTKGQVTCVAFFNYEQWKVDYATIPSQDIIRRNRLDYIYHKYNNLMNNNYEVDSTLTDFDAYGLDGKKKEHWTITDADGLGQINWDDYKLDIDNSSAKAESKETLKNGTIKKQEENPLTDSTERKSPLSVVPSEMDLTRGVYKAYNVGGLNSAGVINSDKKLIKVAYDSITTPSTGLNGNTYLIGYVQTTTNTKSYVYGKYCVNKEGKVYESDGSGNCKDGTQGKNAFYTDFSDVNNTEGDADVHNIKGTVSVTSSLPKSNLNIYNNEDICPIKIIDGPPPGIPEAYCKLSIISGDSYGDKTFINGSNIEIQIEFYTDKGIKIKPDSFALAMTSPYRAEVSTNKYNKLSLKTSALATGLESIHLEGTFTYQNKRTTPCKDDITIIQKGNLCDIEKKQSKVYNVNTNVAEPAVVMGGMLNQRIIQDTVSSDHYPTNLGRLGRPKVEGGLYKYLLDLKKSYFDNQSVVVGYVNNGSKGEFCLRPEGTPNQCVKNTETGFGLYLPGQYAEITEYCKDNWAKDTYGFDSEYDCVDTCAMCPTGENEVIGWEANAQDTQDNINKVNEYCDAYATHGYSSKDTCISLVYERCINPGEYKYRPVNASNPFPSAVDNANIAPGYNVGERIIGSNWKNKEHYITEGDPSTPRYQIALTSDRIKIIRSEFSKEKKVGIYTHLNPTNNLEETKSYMSKYIRETAYFYNMFCYIQGEKTNNIGGCNYE